MPPPILLFVAHPLTGHLTPTLRVAAALASRLPPRSVFLLGPTSHQSRISSASASTSASGSGITFLPLLGSANIDDLAYYSPTTNNPPCPKYWTQSWQQRGLVDFVNLWIDPLPDAWASVVAALRHVSHVSDLSDLDEGEPLGLSSGGKETKTERDREKETDKETEAEGERDRKKREIVLISEALFFGTLPLAYGAPLPQGIRLPRMVALSVTVPFIQSEDLPAFFVPNTSTTRNNGLSVSSEFLKGDLEVDVDVREKKKKENKLTWQQWEACTSSLQERLESRLQEVGATKPFPGPFLSGQNYTCHERILQLGVEGWFFPRRDWPEGFRFVGVLPPAEEPVGGWTNLPRWWEEVKTARAVGKKVVVVAQGTVEVDPNDLIIPTISAMASREHVLVVAILGRKGAVLPREFSLPANARITDYLHYDAVLPYADAWVHNGGYGAVQHGIAHGVPMVVAGEGQDKTENAKRIAWSGVGLDLGRPSPATRDVRTAVDSVLDIERYKQRAQALRRESEDLSCFRAIEREILALLKSEPLN